MKIPECTYCHEPYHTSVNCWKKAKKTPGRTRLKPSTKPIRRVGKEGKKNAADRKQWIKENPPNHQGYWECYLQISSECYRWVDKYSLNVEHPYSKVRRPDLKHDTKKMLAACPPCNALKGSNNVVDIDKR